VTEFELGIFTCGELTAALDGTRVTAQERIADILGWVSVADSSGLAVFGVGEHHREDFAISSPQVVLATAAAMTSRIRLTSTVTVLSSADPVRTFEDFAALDLIPLPAARQSTAHRLST
jgi:alkanesulfonate monooxygenase SsuD/methylene tetrahydromethanopterin reductase-like flavin-dependent oxidoreductase (luciferase family)